ncbi:ABC transporter substrate-binding protein [Mycobacterium talmoniae]|uniref:ABC transporter substrate-binding protein n=1 Tax=Mycobacterium talmoniae TaxID=1858794 RepID=UPI001A95BB61|nr:ABC transporter substrate-binding protein [Mycobacterium talmoniae]
MEQARADRRLVALAVATVLALSLGGCSVPPDHAAATERRDCITDFRPDTDYFPDKSTITEATNFTLSYHRSYQVLTVNQPYPHGHPESYVLVRCGAPAPQLTGELADAPRVSVPVDSLYSASTTHLGMLAELHQTDVITGVATTAAVVDPQVRHRIDDGHIVAYAPGQQVNVEAVIAGRPAVLITGGLDDPSYPKLRDAGIGVIADAEWLEATPLGRAEWIKVMAALTGTEQAATRIYDRVRADYRAVAAEAAAAPPVDVLLGSMYQGSWSMPAGGDYAGRLVLDAGGRYPWAAEPGTGSLQLNFESVYARAGHAPLWLVTTDWASTAQVLAADPRYGELAAVRDGHIWAAAKAIGAGGGNDYWERGPARPDLVLADLTAILHPDRHADHHFVFYRQVAA